MEHGVHFPASTPDLGTVPDLGSCAVTCGALGLRNENNIKGWEIEAAVSLYHGALVCGHIHSVGVRQQGSHVPGEPGEQVRIVTCCVSWPVSSYGTK